MEAQLEEIPPVKAAEVVAEEMPQDEGKRKAAEIMAFLAKQEVAQANTPMLQKVTELELEDEE